MHAEEVSADKSVPGLSITVDPGAPQCLVRLLHRQRGSVPRAAPGKKVAATVGTASTSEDVSRLLGTPDRRPMSHRERRSFDTLRARLFDAPPSEPRTISRYELLGAIGSGGFGVVYRAFDPELEREVAIKVLDSRSLARTPSRPWAPDASRQLLAEAQAIARLSHPSIVAVHHVGTFPGLEPTGGPPQVFMVMELVDGKSVSEWLTQRVRDWREVLDVFAQAGRGLAAAHAAGVVHRDFKPGNAVIGRDGTVRVLDFGLAQPEPGSGTSWSSHSGHSTGDGDSPRGIAGTPVYMSPEATAGDPVDARSDQYSFCVALHLGLYGWRPLTELPREQAARVRNGDRQRRPVPRHVARAIRRGLAVDPSRRWPSMDALLDALTREPHRARLVVPAGLVCVGVGALVLSQPASPRCPDAAPQLAAIWNAERQAEVRHAMQRSQVSFAHDSWPRVKTGLDAYADAWAGAHHQVCVAADLEQRESAAALDVRMHCLASARRELAALVDVLAEADRSTVVRAVESIAALPDPVTCEAAGERHSSLEPPVDPSERPTRRAHGPRGPKSERPGSPIRQ